MMHYLLNFQFASENILTFCIRGLLGSDQETTLQAFCTGVSDVTREEIPRDLVGKMESDMDTAVVLLLRDFPVTVQVNSLTFFGIVYSV